MSILAWIILGAIAGWIASIVMKTNAQMGAFANIIVGVLGALLGGFLVQLLGGEGLSGFSFYSLIVAIFGAVVLLAIVRSFNRV
jgi:uncharacterized membrane protein YeaQ/YmgE (transglycosylase-associated protein family)